MILLLPGIEGKCFKFIYIFVNKTMMPEGV